MKIRGFAVIYVRGQFQTTTFCADGKELLTVIMELLDKGVTSFKVQVRL